MKKIPSLFQRDRSPGNHQVYNEVTPGCEWVLAGEGVATEKMDGTCCLIRDGKMYKRYELKKGKTAPSDFEPAQEPDPITGDIPGWIPVGDGPEDKYHREALEAAMQYQEAEGLGGLPEGTYELIGPKVQGNPHEMFHHVLYKHGDMVLTAAPRNFEDLKVYLAADAHACKSAQFDSEGVFVRPIEGIVWHHPDGRMAKIKRRDFGLDWPTEKEK